MQGVLSGGWGQVVVILIGILLGVLYNNSKINDLRSSTDKRFDDLKDFIRSEVHRLGDRIERLERPIQHS
jgi:hypothetical protein